MVAMSTGSNQAYCAGKSIARLPGIFRTFGSWQMKRRQAAMWGGIDHQLYGIDGGRSAIDRHCLKKTSLGGLGLRLFHRLVPNSAISIEYFWNMAIRLLVNSAMTVRISTGDLIVASLWANSKANCMLACAISSSFS
jgi:hypothetical protein